MNDGTVTPPLSQSARTDSLTSLSSVSTMSSESHLLYNPLLYQQDAQYSVNHKTTSRVFETPVIEMGTAEVKQYSTTSSAQLADHAEVVEAEFSPKVFAPSNPNTMSNILPPPTPVSPSAKESLALSAHRIKELEEQVKTIPILQVRISVLKEEKRLLNLQLKASQASGKPPVSSIGFGDDSVHVDKKLEKLVCSPRQVEFPKSFSTESAPPQKSPLSKTPPATLPKPVKTSSIAVGDHSVIEPYLLQPDLPTGYTTQDNETHTEIHKTTVIERERILKSFIQPPSLNRSFHLTTSQESLDRESHLPSSSPVSSEPRFTINQIQRSSPKALTRTVGVGDGNVFEGSGLHVHEKELRTVIIGQNATVAKRNVGIDCRVPTRDVGVSFMCDEEKPATRTIGVNVNYDTSGILTSLDFKGETELRMALRGVLQRSVHSVGTNCNFKVSSSDAATVTENNSGVSVGCGDEEHRIDVEVRPATVKKSQGVTAKPDCLPKCVSTDKDWVLDASTNTFMVDQYHKASMTEKQKTILASTNTDPTPVRQVSIQTELNVFMNNSQIKHAVTNTENPAVFSTGMVTDIISGINSATNTDSVHRSDAGVNTTEKVSDLFQTASVQKKAPELKSILKKPQHIDKGIGDEVADEDSYSFSEITEVITPITFVTVNKHENFNEKRAHEISTSFSQSGSMKQKSQADDTDHHFASQDLSIQRAKSDSLANGKQETLVGSSSSVKFESGSSAFERVSPTKAEDTFQETVIEHYVITRDGKRLVSEEKTTTSSRGGASSEVKQISRKTSGQASSSVGLSSSHGDSDGSSSGTRASLNGRLSGGSKVDRSHITISTNPYVTLENLSEVSALVDSSDLVDDDADHGPISKTSSEGNLYTEKTASRNEITKSMDAIFDMRRTGSVEDFMPDDIKKYMSIETSMSKDSGFGEDLQNRFAGEQDSGGELTAGSGQLTGGAGVIRSVKLSKTITTTATTKNGEKVTVQETKSVEGPDGKSVTTVIEKTEDGQRVVHRYEDGHRGPHSDFLTLGDESETLSSASSITYSSVHSDSSVVSGQPDSVMYTSSDSDLTANSGNYSSLDRATLKLKSIMKTSSADTERKDKKTGIRFAESVTGGTGSSSEEDDDTSDSDSTTSFEEGSYDSQQGEVVYKCKDDEAIARGMPGAHMFDQNIRETYELSNDVQDACNVLATYLRDSTEVQTKQLTASQNLVQQEWFQVSSLKLSSPHQVEDFLSSVNEISKSLLKYIINMSDTNGNTAIHYCISHCNFDTASLLLDSEVCDINKQNKAGYTPIMLAGLATIQGLDQLEVVRRIFSTGDINARASETQQTALMLAASHGKTEMVKLLVEEGAEINLQDVDGSTALMCACEHGHLDIVNFLLSQPNIDAKITDNENSTALSIAMEAGHKDVGVVLYKHLNFSKPTSPRPSRNTVVPHFTNEVHFGSGFIKQDFCNWKSTCFVKNSVIWDMLTFFGGILLSGLFVKAITRREKVPLLPPQDSLKYYIHCIHCITALM
ncbi:hypothetical protein Btru_046401 [Bulinus truncatus]|nr:hypothetical protein Btru_046401 [Bulinus truncatus]